MPDSSDLSGEARVASLAFAYLEGVLTPAEADELSALLARDPAAGDAFVRVCYHDGLIAESFRDTYRLAPTPVRPDPLPRPRRPIKARLIRPWRWPVSLAAAVVFAVGIGYLGFRQATWREPAPVPELVRLTRSIDCQWKGKAPSLDGDLPPGSRFELADGLAEFRFASGIRVTVQGGTDLTVVGRSQVRLNAGALIADVPPAGVGFRVETPAGSVIDLGTWFQVKVERSATTIVEMYEGAVNVIPADALGNETRVSAPAAVRFSRTAVQTGEAATPPSARRLYPGVVATERARPVSAQQGSITPRTFREGVVSVVQERTDHVLTKDLSAGPFRQGDYLKNMPAGEVISRGTRVHSYLIHTGAGSAEGRVEFAAPIIGVIPTTAGLVATDEELTATKFEGWSDVGRGVDGTATDDDKNRLWLSPNRKSLWVCRASPLPSQFRVLLGAEE
jgi:ferric-dicitrate binding protein FerR (iron transport regulator)